MAIWKFTSEEKKLIRAMAGRASSTARITLEAGERCNTVDMTVENSVNQLLVDLDPDNLYSDLADLIPWKDICKQGVPLNEKGEAEVDFYVYSLGEYGGLETNIQVNYQDGRIHSISSKMGNNLYHSEGV